MSNYCGISWLKQPTLMLSTITLASGITTYAQSNFASDVNTTTTQRAPIVWDLTDVFQNDNAWKTEYDSLKKRISSLHSLQKQLKKQSSSVADVLEEVSTTRKAFTNLYSYASLKKDEDQRQADGQERIAMVRALSTEFSEATSWLNPALLAMGEKKIKKFLAKEPRLQPFSFYLEDLFRSEPHLLDQQGEALLASASSVLNSPSGIYSLLVNADVPWPEITLSDGEKLLLNQSGYTRARSADNRDDRKAVFDQFWGIWGDYQDSLGAILATEVKANIFEAKARNYDSVLHQQLAEENLPENVYRTLISEVNESLPTLHRYFKLRGKLLGVEKMHYYDIYPPLVEMDIDFGIERSKDITLEVTKPLGKEYATHLEKGVNADWMHVYPQPGKRSGAYMSGSMYDIHPYVFLNHNDDFNSLSTYAHEWGHAVHTMFTNEAQPFEKAGYSIFIAEIAAIVNEVLIEEHLIANAKTKEEKLFYLGQALESIRGTFYRQAMFAEFELAIHETVEAGKPLTGKILSGIYGDILKKYHDHDGGTLFIDDAYTMEWAFIPHFYYEFYVYQYATSISGAVWFVDQILKGDEDMLNKYINVLKAGGSDYPYEILQQAGLDMAQPDPYRAIVTRMNSIMDQIEELL